MLRQESNRSLTIFEDGMMAFVFGFYPIRICDSRLGEPLASLEIWSMRMVHDSLCLTHPPILLSSNVRKESEDCVAAVAAEEYDDSHRIIEWS